jgi:hypothetical protein
MDVPKRRYLNYEHRQRCMQEGRKSHLQRGEDQGPCKHTSAAVCTGNTFQNLPLLRETADNTERYT